LNERGDMRKDPVTPELRQRVMERDWYEVNLWLEGTGVPGPEIHQWQTRPVCVAPMLDPSQSRNCWGRSTLDHVKDDLMMGKRAASDERHLVTLCEGHTENGSRGGFQWNTANRPLLRMYLERVSRPRAGSGGLRGLMP
jgi:hypothetical protein